MPLQVSVIQCGQNLVAVKTSRSNLVSAFLLRQNFSAAFIPVKIFSRNIAYVTPEIIYFYYLKKYFLDQSIQKINYLILKKNLTVSYNVNFEVYQLSTNLAIGCWRPGRLCPGSTRGWQTKLADCQRGV